MGLTKPFHNNYYHVYRDNFFTSLALFDELLQCGLYACETVRMDRRGLPPDLKGLRLERGCHGFRQRGNLSTVVWQDKRQVSTLSTIHNPAETAPIRRKGKDGTQKTLRCPTAIISHNQNMAGVDKGHQLQCYYRLRLKYMNNYKNILFFLLGTAITNAFILYSKFTTSPTLTMKEFRLALAEQLIGHYCGRIRMGCPHHSATARPLSVLQPQHFPRKQAAKRKCVFCNDCRQPPCKRESRWFCGDCDGHPALCLTGKGDDSDCWRLWHSQ